jgi:predicted transcriptional regulator
LDLLKALSSSNTFEILDYLKKHPDSNASKIAKALGLHVLTVQRHLEVLEKYGIVKSRIAKGVGRPSKKYRYLGGSVEVNVDEILELYQLKNAAVREKVLDNVVYDCDMRKEVVRRFLNKLDKRKIIFDEMEGKVLWFIPPPDSKGKSVKEIAKETGFSLIQVLEIIKRLADLGLVELMNT